MPTWRRIISSAALLVIATALGYAGIQCWRVVIAGGPGVLALVGSVLLIAAPAFAVATVAPISLVENIFGPHHTPNDSSDSSERWSWIVWLLNIFSGF